MNIKVDANIGASVDLFSKSVTDLQENITINGKVISGTLKWIDDYSSAFLPPEDEGNYLALHIDTTGATSGTVEVINGTHGQKDLDLSDGIVVLRITNKDT